MKITLIQYEKLKNKSKREIWDFLNDEYAKKMGYSYYTKSQLLGLFTLEVA